MTRLLVQYRPDL